MQATVFNQVIAANVGREVTPEQLIKAFEASFGAGSSAALTLVCSDGGFLSEIRIALKATSLEGELDGGDLYRSGSAPASRCPATMRIDAAGP